INVIDGKGNLYDCVITEASAKRCSASVVACQSNWGSHPYNLTMAVCPTKNNERFEWFVEKAVEIGLDSIAPVIGEHSERKVYKCERAVKIAISAAKQSLKGAVPDIEEPVSVKDFIKVHKDEKALKMIAYCFEDETHPRQSIKDVLESYTGEDIIIMIGPEGDFSKEEAALAMSSGYIPVHLGASRLRTETAALTAVQAVYLKFM
ncbi:MAG: 16S rRNA (uracil(1498)-N(3))-methyltransferase, partial [Bacteroidales bacterium]|nr:16S rRNA (uracil(1498)-N(3))-methyltransferase [Bacteroidales bacterium]